MSILLVVCKWNLSHQQGIKYCPSSPEVYVLSTATISFNHHLRIFHSLLHLRCCIEWSSCLREERVFESRLNKLLIEPKMIHLVLDTLLLWWLSAKTASVATVSPLLNELRNIEIQDLDYWFLTILLIIYKDVSRVHVSVDNSIIMHIFDTREYTLHYISS